MNTRPAPTARFRPAVRPLHAIVVAGAFAVGVGVVSCTSGNDGVRTLPGVPAATVADDDLVSTLDLGAPEPLAPAEPPGGGGAGPGGGTDGSGGAADADGAADSDDPVVPQGEPALPACADVVVAGHHLAVGPAEITLEPGDMAGALTIASCADGDVDWTATAPAGVSLSQSAATIEAGLAQDVTFTIDAEAFAPGPFDVVITVDEPTGDHDVIVHAHRTTSLDAGADDLAPAPGTVTCDDGCIDHAEVAKNLATTNVTVSVGTSMATIVQLYVLDQPPVMVGEEPVVVGLTPDVIAAETATEHELTIEGLDEATTYWVIVEALDDFGGAHRVVGSFETISLLEPQLDVGGGPTGCTTSCVTEALLSPTADGLATHLHVETHTSAYLTFWASPDPFPVDEDERLIPPDPAAALATSGDLDVTTWDTDVALPYDTDLHVVVGAEDLSGHTSYETGTYHTADAPTLVATFRQVNIDENGDSNGVGEIGFSWGTGDGVVDSAAGYELADGESVALLGGPSVDLPVDATMNALYFAAIEFDDAELLEYCPHIYDSVWHEGGDEREDCGYTVNPLTPLEFFGTTYGDLPRCDEIGYEGWGDSRCVVAHSVEAGGPFTSYSLVVTVDVQP